MGKNTDELETRLNFSLTACLGKAAFFFLPVSQVLFPVVNWEVKCLTAGPSKLITIKKAARSEENTGCLQLTTCCDVTPGSQNNQTFLLSL